MIPQGEVNIVIATNPLSRAFLEEPLILTEE